MADMLEGCISSVDPQRKDYRAFQEAFCVRCRNVQCVHAQGHKDKFALRTSQQVQRMLHGQRANPQLPKYAHLEDFGDYRHQAMRKEIVDRRGDWTVPEIPILDGCQESASLQTTSAVDRAIQSLAGTRGRGVDLPEPEQDTDEFTRKARGYMDEEEPPFEVCVEDVAESAGSEPIELPKQAPVAPQMGNTPRPRGGIVIGKGPVPQSIPGAPDPWAPPKPVGQIIKLGSTFQFETPDKGDE